MEIANLLTNRDQDGVLLLQRALALCQVAGAEQLTPFGESCLAQGLAMGDILHKLHVDSTTLAAAMLYSTVQYTDLELKDVEEHLNGKIAKLIQGTQRMNSVSELYHDIATSKKYQHNVDNIRKMLLAMVDDIRVVLIKLAEQLYLLRHACKLPLEQQQQFAKEIMAIYAPLANRLGMVFIKRELEDLAFQYLEPQKFDAIITALNTSRIEREEYIAEFISMVQNLLATANIPDCQVKGRAKHTYSIYLKMQRKQVNFSEIYDVCAIRILTHTIDDCYHALSCIHAQFPHIAKEFDDYIAKPKSNGYRSIHTAIIGPQNRNIEIQIRTYAMHQESELGVAAHWMYKEQTQTATNYETKIAWLRQIMDWQHDLTQDEKIIEEIRRIFSDRVYVFTPHGDILELPHGATPLDFAYAVHTEIGHRCVGAKVNGSIVPLTYNLNTSDHIEILTGKNSTPKRDWINPELGYLKTSRAKSKVLHWLRKDEPLPQKNILRSEIKQTKSDHKTTLKDSVVTTTTNSSKPFNTNDIHIHGLTNLLTRIANCCKPLPGENIIGYVTQANGVSIHRDNCPNVLRAIKQHPEKSLFISWGNKTIAKYSADLVINAVDRQGLVRDITSVIADENLAIDNLTFNNDPKHNIAYINLTISVDGTTILERIIAKLQQIHGIIEIKRKS